MKKIYELYDRFIVPIVLSFFFLRTGGFLACTLKKRQGQTTVEYMLMLAVVVGMILIGAVLFHKKILGGFFTMVGMVIGGGDA
ncbi:MAG: hypothetical protein KAR84_02680 [Elusimicrobiales bacterium]|nr:hypothetical protein [Elusimicrobiales bacterium]